jgi:hypothetical protein
VSRTSRGSRQAANYLPRMSGVPAPRYQSAEPGTSRPPITPISTDIMTDISGCYEWRTMPEKFRIGARTAGGQDMETLHDPANRQDAGDGSLVTALAQAHAYQLPRKAR